jgi:abortive infection bacteriophage resistance protein
MNLDKKQFQLLLSKWMRWDAELWRELRDLQLKILHERILEEKSFQDLAVHYKYSPQKLRRIFLAILIRIEKRVSSGMADLLRKINTDLEAKEKGINPNSPLGTIYLN